ncbi:hypothetical protein KL921_000316 [Ogataea angusta]|nr:hypothetical protein KL921_000316 [Ogataea angusta]KAG7831348.1 hypothetical protein KL920_000868 [Ogataea angusta]KAG7837291.1 hypothetical protein KL943_001330 [Ogataea angusta]KAG7853423.1 hypothetical protein KL941_000473 [Ogataea angusta]
MDVGVDEARHEKLGFRVSNVDETHLVQLQAGEFQSVGGVVGATFLHENYSPVLVNSNGTVREHLQSAERRGLDKRPEVAGELYRGKTALQRRTRESAVGPVSPVAMQNTRNLCNVVNSQNWLELAAQRIRNLVPQATSTESPGRHPNYL